MNRVAARDAARARHDKKRAAADPGQGERRDMMREKEKATMDMFKALAAERFGN